MPLDKRRRTLRQDQEEIFVRSADEGWTHVSYVTELPCTKPNALVAVSMEELRRLVWDLCLSEAGWAQFETIFADMVRLAKARQILCRGLDTAYPVPPGFSVVEGGLRVGTN